MSRTRPLLVAALALFAWACASPEPRSVVVVTLDTFRADRMGAYGNRDGLTPALDAFAEASVVFEAASAPTPITLPSHTSLFTGRYPTAHGVRNNGTFVVPAGETTLAEILKERGFRTGAVVASFPLQSRYGLAQGFDLYDEEFPEGSPNADGSVPVFFQERDARAVTDRALQVWGKLGDSRRLLWVHYFDAHAPYAAPEPFASRHAKAPYDGEIAWLDGQVGRLLARVREDDPNAIVVIAADHGESLGEHGEKTHGVFVYESTIHVPFVLRAPGLDARRVAEPVSLVDVLPTVLGRLGIPVPAGVEGADLGATVLAGKAAARPIYAESWLPKLQFRFSELTALRRGSLKRIDAPAPELYDLAQDPREERNLEGGHPDGEAMAEALAAFRAAEDPQASERAAGGLSAEDEAKLRSLGYTSAGSLRSNPGEGRGRDPKAMTDYLQRYDRAVGLASAGRQPEAIPLLRALVPEAPENFMVRYQLGTALLTAGNVAEAAAEFAEVIRVAPEFANGYLLAATAEGRLGRVDDAARHYEAAIALAPDLVEPRVALGRLLESVGRFEAAAEAYLAAAKAAPQDAEPSRRLLELRQGRGEGARGIGDLAALAASLPRAAGIWSVVGQARRRAGDLEGARAASERASAADPFLAEAMLLRGELSLEARDPAGALETFDAVLARRADRADAMLGRAKALLALGRAVEAEATLAEISRRYPRLSDGITLRGRFLEQTGERAAAAQAYREALRVNPGDVAAREGLRRLSR
ncbi:MAG TPA: sulfatase-like hydrolase/transferase [Candidatus Polarisedimenticolaceae bacterium]